MKKTTLISLISSFALFAGLSSAEAAVKTVTFQIVNHTNMPSYVFRTQGSNAGSCDYNSNNLTLVCKTDAKGSISAMGEFTGPKDPFAMGPILTIVSPSNGDNFQLTRNPSAGLVISLSTTKWPTDGKVVTINVDLSAKK